MPELRVTEPHSLTTTEVRSRLAGFAEMLAKYGARLSWEGDTARIAGVPGVGGQIAVTPAHVSVHVTVSRMVTMMGLDVGKLETTMRRRLKEVLRTSPSS
jgi:putative polyhydroxyalkanoate system protein